jgi:hypothetical protein
MCRQQDAILEHGFRPDCAMIERWGPEIYEVFTNNLAFRDHRMRDVPRVDPRPRLLLLGDSFTEGKIAWNLSFAGRIANRFPQYDFLNGGVTSYSPSNYLNIAAKLLQSGVEFDEAMVFIDISDAQDEAAYYRDAGIGTAVKGPEHRRCNIPRYSDFREWMKKRLLLTSYMFESIERTLIRHGFYHLNVVQGGNLFDLERSAWTYRKVSDTDPFDSGYGPLGLEGGLAKERQKMTQLRQMLAARGIPISVVVYPWPAQLIYDTEDSRQVRIWRDWCGGNCKRFISLFPKFFAVKKQCSWSEPGCWYPEMFLFGDYHFSSAGNELVADAVIRSLEAAKPEKVDRRATAGPRFGD